MQLIHKKYTLAGIPPICRLRDWPAVTRLYPDGDLAPTTDELHAWYKNGTLIASPSHSSTLRRDHHKYVDVHATLHSMGILPDDILTLINPTQPS